MPIIVKQFGFSTGAGALANLVDGDLNSFWAPLATDFNTYRDQFFLADKVTLNYGKPFPALEFDLGEPKRVPQIFFRTESGLTFGPGILIGSNVGATSPADTLQVGDILLAQYTSEQLTSNRYIDVPVMRDSDIKRRYLRLLQRSSAPDVIAPTPGPANSITFDRGAGQWPVVEYSNQLIIEVWGAGASGGISSQAQDGGQSWAGKDSWPSKPTANGGSKAAATAANAGPAGTGGSAMNGNTANINGGNGSTPLPLDVGWGITGKGGDAPNGGLGGAAIAPPFSIVVLIGIIFFGQFRYGNDGQAPGGGGGGRFYWFPSGSLASGMKFPGGGSGSYSKHVIDRHSGLADPGTLIPWHVGNGGISSAGDGRGAQGRVRFSWT